MPTTAPHTIVSHGYYADPSQETAPAMMPFNTWDVRVFVTGKPTAYLFRTIGPCHVDEADALAREFHARATANGEDVRGCRAQGKFTADGRYCWSGKPLQPGPHDPLGPHTTVGQVDWATCRALGEGS